MMFFILMAVTVSIRADGYGISSSSQNAVAPAPVPYGAPYSSSAAAQQQQQPVQYQPYTNMINQPVPIGMPHGLTGFPTTMYGMYAAQPQQLSQSPYQMYGQQPLSTSLYMNYPQGMVLSRQQQQPQQQQPQQQQQGGMAGLPSQAGITYLTPSYLPSTSVSSSPSTGYAGQPTISGPSLEHEPTVPGAPMNAFTSLSPSTIDPWASLGSVTPKKTDNRKKKNSEGV